MSDDHVVEGLGHVPALGDGDEVLAQEKQGGP